MKQYIDLVNHVLQHGTRKPNRTGVDTLSTFGYYYEIDLKNGFPLLTTKEMSWKNIVIEMLWFLSGQTDISILKQHGCKFWDAWADENGKVPSAYGNFWRKFPTHEPEAVCAGCDRPERGGPHDCTGRQVDYRQVPERGVQPAFNDQIKFALDELKRNPMSRRLVVSAWAPGNAQTSKLPPCHCMFMFNVQNAEEATWTSVDKNGYTQHIKGEPIVTQQLCLHLTQRSCDVALGVPYNIASYALLLELFSRFTGIKPGIFAHTLVDAHIYTCKADGSMGEYDHIPGLQEQVKRQPKKLPKLIIDPAIKDISDVEALMDPKLTTDEIMKHFVLEGYEPHPAIKFRVAV